MNLHYEHASLKTQNCDSEIFNKIERFAKDFQASFPDYYVEIDRFTSGCIVFDVCKENKLFVLNYHPKHGFGVDEIKEHNSFTAEYSFVTDNVNTALWQLSKIIKLSETV